MSKDFSSLVWCEWESSADVVATTLHSEAEHMRKRSKELAKRHIMNPKRFKVTITVEEVGDE